MNGFDRDHADMPWEAAPGTAASDWELAAAACDLAWLRRSTTAVPALPADLAGRIGRDAAAHLPRTITLPSASEPEAPRSRPIDRSWTAAAGWWTVPRGRPVCLAIAVCDRLS